MTSSGRSISSARTLKERCACLIVETGHSLSQRGLLFDSTARDGFLLLKIAKAHPGNLNRFNHLWTLKASGF